MAKTYADPAQYDERINVDDNDRVLLANKTTNKTEFATVFNLIKLIIARYDDALAAQIIQFYSPEYLFQGFVDQTSVTPSVYTKNHAWISIANGVVFGKECVKGAIIVDTGSEYLVEVPSSRFVAKKELHSLIKSVDAYYVEGGRKVVFDESSPVRLGYYKYDLGGNHTWVDSTAGYVTTLLLDVITPSIFYTGSASGLVCRIIFFDAEKNIISAIPGDVGVSNKEYTIPENAVYYSCTVNSTITPYEVYVDHDGLKEELSILKSDVVSAIKDTDLETIKSENLANPSKVHEDIYVVNDGKIFAGSGWKILMIDVSELIGQQLTLGNFTIDSNGYGAFYDDTFVPEAGSGGLVELLSTFFANNTLPFTTQVVPYGSKWLVIDIARPTNLDADNAEIMVNSGSILLPYEQFFEKITKIKGKELDAGDSYDQSLNTTDDVAFNSITTSVLIANLPAGTFEPAGLVAGQAWIDTSAGNVIKVK